MIGKKIGSYLIQEKIGEGGMGVVYKAVHTQIDQVVAIKAIYPQYAKDKNFKERFRREAKVQAKLHHPNVVNILNYIEDDEGNIYIVMEYINGGTLENKIAQRKLTLDEIVSITVQVLNALSYMHSNGIIHRDIKPSNIMFSDGFVKVSDFGIAKPAEDKGLTRTGTIMGTVWYMAPEIIQGRQASYSSDLYAVGVMLYQMLTGKAPFFGKTDFEIMKAHLEKEPPSIRELNPNLPEGIDTIVRKALAKRPEERFSNAEEFKKSLLDWYSGVSDRAPAVEGAYITSPVALGRTLTNIRRTYMLAGVFIILLIILMLMFLIFLRKDSPKDVPELLRKDLPSVPTTPQPYGGAIIEKKDNADVTEKKEEVLKPVEEKKPPKREVVKRRVKEEREKPKGEKEKDESAEEKMEGGKEGWKVIK